MHARQAAGAQEDAEQSAAAHADAEQAEASQADEAHAEASQAAASQVAAAQSAAAQAAAARAARRSSRALRRSSRCARRSATLVLSKLLLLEKPLGPQGASARAGAPAVATARPPATISILANFFSVFIALSFQIFSPSFQGVFGAPTFQGGHRE